MKPDIRPCTVTELEAAPNLAALLAEYGAESAIDGLGAPNAQFSSYRQMEAAGVLHPLGAFQGTVLVGFLILLVSPLPHFGVRVGTSESYFVTATARKLGVGLTLRRYAERLAQSLGAIGFFISAPRDGKLSQVLEMDKAYRETNRVYFRSFL